MENGLTLVAVGMISALAVLQRTRLAAFETMRANERAAAESPYEIRRLISRLSEGVNELQLDLAFGVEAYVDSLLIPETVMEAFQSSLRDALGIPASLDNSARMVERLTSVISARSAALDAQLAERDDRRDRTVSALVAVATGIALPPTLLLAFFGANASNVDNRRSIFDAHYLPAYLLAWLPFIALAVIGYLLLRRVSRRSGPLRGTPAGERARAAARATVTGRASRGAPVGVLVPLSGAQRAIDKNALKFCAGVREGSLAELLGETPGRNSSAKLRAEGDSDGTCGRDRSRDHELGGGRAGGR